MQRSRTILRVLPAMAVVAIALGTHLSAGPSASTGRASHPAVKATSGRFEAPLIRFKAFDAHQQRADAEGRRVALGILTGTAALVMAALLSIIGLCGAHRDETLGTSGTRVRAPPLRASWLTGPAALV